MMFGVVIPSGAGSEPAQAALPAAITGYVTAAAAMFLIGLAALTHAGLVGHPDSWLDLIAAIAMGALFGVVPAASTRAQLAANTAAVMAAHDRLDSIAAPPVADRTSGG